MRSRTRDTSAFARQPDAITAIYFSLDHFVITHDQMFRGQLISHRASQASHLINWCTVRAPRSNLRRESLLARKGLKPLSLDQFLQRSRVLHLYRDIVRATKRIADQDTKMELRRFARTEFESQRLVDDATTIRYLLAKGKTQFDGMRRYIDEQAG